MKGLQTDCGLLVIHGWSATAQSKVTVKAGKRHSEVLCCLVCKGLTREALAGRKRIER